MTSVPSTPAPLPPGWQSSTLGTVADYINGRGFKSSEWGTTGRPILRIQNLTGSRDSVNRFDGDVEERHLVREGDLLISWAATLGAYIYHGEEAALNQHIFKVRPYIDKKFLYFGVTHYIRNLLAQSRGSGMVHVTKGDFESTPFPLPPLAEQGRIVEKVEELFSKLDAGVAELRRTQGLLKRYRQSLLHAAVTGELSRDWRAQNPATETGDDLLQRLLAERRDRWARSGKRGKYTEPAGPETEGLPELPEEWTWASVEQLGDVGTGATPLKGERKYYDAGDVPWVTSGALNDDFVREPTGLITELAVKETNAKKFPIGTLLVAMYGEGKTRGKVSELAIEAATNQACAAVKINSSDTLKDFVKLYFKWNYDNIRRASAGGVQPNLSLGIIKAIALPVPPLPEQEFIVAEVERRLSVLDNLEATVAAELKRAESTRQSILHRAFTGQLVPQDPADEPASALLDRIQAERVAAGAAAIRAGAGSGKRGRPRKAQDSDPLLTTEE